MKNIENHDIGLHNTAKLVINKQYNIFDKYKQLKYSVFQAKAYYHNTNQMWSKIRNFIYRLQWI